jgi:hypothetical protein
MERYTGNNSVEEYHNFGGVVPVIHKRKFRRDDGSIEEVMEQDFYSTKMLQQAYDQARALKPNLDWDYLSIEQMKISETELFYEFKEVSKMLADKYRR